MPVPSYDKFIEPVLRYLASCPDGARAADVHDAAADALALSEQDRAELLPSGRQAVYKNRCGWAHDRLKRAGLSESPRRGRWRLTDQGRCFLDEQPTPIPEATIADIATTDIHVRLSANEPHADEPTAQHHADEPVLSATTPDERLESALAEIVESVSGELLEMIGQSDPSFFERLVLDMLHAMGYGLSRSALRQVGGSADGGIDGIITLDRLGLEKVYVQAKRWTAPVGRPEVQGFYGALAGRRATKGVFLTTSTFTQQARDFADSIERIVLVDGRQLTQNMVEFGVGVSHRTFRIPKLDSDYFDI